MKKIHPSTLIRSALFIVALILLTLAGLTLGAQTIQMDSAGNYRAVRTLKIESKPQATGKTFIDSRGNVYPIYRSQSGKMYVLRTSGKTGNIYKQYLKIN